MLPLKLGKSIREENRNVFNVGLIAFCPALVVVKTFRAVALGFVTVATGFFVSVHIAIYGGFPLWFV